MVFSKRDSTWQTGQYLANWIVPGKLDSTWQTGQYMANWIVLGKLDSPWQTGQYLANWKVLGKLDSTWQTGQQLANWIVLDIIESTWLTRQQPASRIYLIQMIVIGLKDSTLLNRNGYLNDSHVDVERQQANVHHKRPNDSFKLLLGSEICEEIVKIGIGQK